MAIGSIGVIFVAAALCGIIALFLHHRERVRLYIKAAKFPGPRALPVIGHAHYFIGSSYDIVDTLMELMNTYSSPLRMWICHQLFILVSDAEQTKIVLDSPYTIEKGKLYKFIRPWLGTGLLTAPATKWRIHRKLIAPTFNKKILDSFVETFAKQSIIMTREMGKELEADEFELHRYVTRCVLNITCGWLLRSLSMPGWNHRSAGGDCVLYRVGAVFAETTMSVKINIQEKYSTYADAVFGMSETISKRIFDFWLHPDLIFNLTKTGRDQREYLKYLHGVTNDVIRTKKSSYNNENRVANKSEHKGPATRKAFLDLLMDMSEDDVKLTAAEVREEVDTMLNASFHTTASLTTFAAVMLANNPELQDRAYRELCNIYGDQVSSETPVKNEDLNRMEYLERVIKETLRLFPVAPGISREITEDLDIGQYTLPKGATVFISILKIHRSEKYWPDPLKFNPDRFLPEEVAKRNPHCYVPFSAGPRNCIGQKYAMMSVKVILATVLRRYLLKRDTILDTKDIKLKADLLQPTKIMTIKISERINENIEK